ncbi:MAG: sugar phosphate nucleotidyltransferase [Bacteroidota bacterium]|jgi:glucose-1-phosphate thymidylyltransferase|nr:sugar phosphate nucleotidyltransferase [Bacteroidota bacterium]|tara:strand:- start:1635 stop:2366 length:732 start_codon:yes stop_codon:yes gene_type:complete
MYSLVVRNLKSVIAAGGLGTRLQNFRGNQSTKILLDVNGIPMINRQIIQLLDWGCEEFVIITNPEFEDLIKKVTTEAFPSLNLKFATQDEPKGISHALKQAEVHVDRDEKILFILGDNFFEKNPIIDFDFSQYKKGSYIFTKSVNNPQEFGVAQMNSNGNVVSIDEKPIAPKSDLAVVGIYIFDETVFEKISTLSPSSRGEYEITDLCNIYVQENTCRNFVIDGWWIDAGTPDRIIELEEKLP